MRNGRSSFLSKGELKKRKGPEQYACFGPLFCAHADYSGKPLLEPESDGSKYGAGNEPEQYREGCVWLKSGSGSTESEVNTFLSYAGSVSLMVPGFLDRHE